MATRSRRKSPTDSPEPSTPSSPPLSPTPSADAPKPGRTPRRTRRASHPEPSSAEVAAESAKIYPDTFDTPPTPDEIAEEAYAIYRDRGGRHGSDVEDWLEAERRVSARRRRR